MKHSETMTAIAYYTAVTGRDVPKAAHAVWFEKFADVMVAETKAAIDRLAVADYPPNVVQIRADVLAHREDGAPGFGAAWKELTEKASTCDWFGALPRFSHPVVAELARQLGWDQFRTSDPTNTYLIHSASERYDDIARRHAEGRLVAVGAVRSDATLTALLERALGEADADA